MQNKKLHIVHCIDTEGPLTETLSATFQRLSSAFGLEMPATRENLAKLQNKELDLNGTEDAVAKMVSPDLLAYNSNWDSIQLMLDELLSEKFRKQLVGDNGNGWVYSWHCMDHIQYFSNPRHKDVGYGNVFNFYRNILAETSSTQDELNWHFHPVSITGNSLNAATNYTNSYVVLNEILCRRILEDGWFPVVNRPGFHSERPDSHAFLEQWIPYDYANQYYEGEVDQPDLSDGRFGDWRRASDSWRGYHPDYYDHQLSGSCKRRIFRCLNVGTRLRVLTLEHVRQAFTEAQEKGVAILAFSDHDFRDIRPDVELVRKMLVKVQPEFPNVSIQFSGAEEAARDLLDVSSKDKLQLSIKLNDNRLEVHLVKGEIFGVQPFLAIKSKDGRVFHDNLDVQTPGCFWTYILDEQTLPLSALDSIGVGSAGRYGGFDVIRMEIN